MTIPVFRNQKKAIHRAPISPDYLATGPFFLGKSIAVPNMEHRE